MLFVKNIVFLRPVHGLHSFRVIRSRSPHALYVRVTHAVYLHYPRAHTYTTRETNDLLLNTHTTVYKLPRTVKIRSSVWACPICFPRIRLDREILFFFLKVIKKIKTDGRSVDRSRDYFRDHDWRLRAHRNYAYYTYYNIRSLARPSIIVQHRRRRRGGFLFNHDDKIQLICCREERKRNGFINFAHVGLMRPVTSS